MRFITFGKIDRKIIPILLGCAFCFFHRSLILFTLFKKSNIGNHRIITNIYVAISKLFTIIPFIIYKNRTNKNNQNEINKINYNNTTNTNKIELIYEDYANDKVPGKGRYLLLSGIIFFIQSFIFLATGEVKSNSWIWDILITSILYYLIFKIKLYKHHYLSVILIILIGFTIDLVLGNLQKDVSENIGFLLLRFLREILYSLHDVINKYLMEKKYCSIYEISLSNGIINLILLGLFALINYFCFDFDKFEEYFDNFNINEFFVAIIIMVTQIVLYLCTLITNKNYTPCHIFIIFVFGQLAYYINISENRKISIICIVCLILILFFSLIFNEIIEINVCGLSDNTKKNIMIRAESEDFYIKKDDTITDESINDKDEKEVELNKDEIYI